MKCGLCHGDTKLVTTSIDTQWGDYKITIHGLKAYRCDACNEEYFDSDEVDVIQNLSAGFAENNSSEKPDVLDVEEVAELLRVSKQTIYNMLKDGRLKAVKVGREWRFPREAVERLLISPGKLEAAAR